MGKKKNKGAAKVVTVAKEEVKDTEPTPQQAPVAE